MRNLGVRLPGEIHAALEAEARTRGCSATEVARAVLLEWGEGRTLAARLQAVEECVSAPHPGRLDEHAAWIASLEKRIKALEGALTVSEHTDIAADLAAHRATQPPDLVLEGAVIDPEGWLTTRAAFVLSGLPESRYRSWQAKLCEGRYPEWERHPDPERRKRRLPWLRKRT